MSIPITVLELQSIVCESAWLCLLSYYATEHFEGAVMATKRIPWWCHLWCVETCWRFANVWRTNFVHVMPVKKIYLQSIAQSILSCILDARVQISSNIPEIKTQFVDVTLTVRKNLEAVHCVRWLPYTSFRTDHPELIILPFGTCNLCNRRRCASDNNNNNNNNNNNKNNT